MARTQNAASDDPINVFGPLLARTGIDIRHESITFTPLTGGVSSDIWRVDVAGKPSLCVKRALAKLKVKADWFAPVSRNAFEVAWYQTADALAPGLAPHVHAHDPDNGMFVMDFLSPDDHALWKDRLLKGDADPVFARAVGSVLGRVHAGTADKPDIAAQFKTDDAFYDLRLEPYLEATARAHPDVASWLHHLVSETQSHKRVLVHGDVSPKNILIGPNGPVFLDAECAWYGDPAFDVAFCINHLLLKCLIAPMAVPKLLACFDAFVAAYLAHAEWEPKADLEARIAHLLPGLFLARIDGKSPVEYLTDDTHKTCVRTVARKFLMEPTDTLSDITNTWRETLNS